ncbi:MAG TPA: EAL domain-containing protein, partial [Candidatus Tenderia electrophaga]|nr:EAL domain-containing protein [Candidatus Tenderia electrophaga]
GYWQAAGRTIEVEKNKVEHLQQQISDLLTNIPQVIWSIDVVNNKPLYISPTVEEISPISMALPIPCLAWTIADDRPKVEAAWARAMVGETITIESRVQAPGNKLRWFKRTFHPFIGHEGSVIRIDGIMEEITAAKLAHTKLELMATTDELTGLANRALWHDRINQNIAIAKRETDKHVVLMLLDLNHFKYVNDTLGHTAGDVVLRQVSHRLEKELREGDTLARLGGDEFAILLPLVGEGKSTAIKVAQKIQASFKEPYFFNGNELYLGVAIGISVYPQHGDDADTLVRCADVAMYRSKRNNLPYQFYKTGMDEPYRNQIQLVSNIKRGLKQDEFELYYQPKIHLETGRISGLEALIRWHHPTQGCLAPADFIPIAEQMGLMKELTEWVVATALKQNMQWGRTGIHTPIAINVSARSFQDHRFVQSIKNALEISAASPESLELEITENTLMSNIDSAIGVIKSLSNLGVKVSIDDFGTGYSSLSYLKRLPIDELKIDQSFVKNMDKDKNDVAIVMSVIDLGHNLGFKVVAEGVERKKPMQMLRALGCDTAQGYHISHPMPTASVAGWMTGAGARANYI